MNKRRPDESEKTEAAEHDRAMADYRAGRLPGLTPDEVRKLLNALDDEDAEA